MAELTAAQVMALRKKTGLPMMECKEALTACGADEEAAIEWLKKKHKGKMESRSERETGEGRVGVHIDASGRIGGVVELRCETAPVAKNELFIDLANRLARRVAAGRDASPDPAALKQSAEAELTEVYGKLREMMNIGTCRKIEGDALAAYVHHDGKRGVLVAMKGKPTDDEVGKNLAMHITFHKPLAVDRESVPADEIAKVRQAAIEQAREEGKPEAVVQKIAEGKVNAFFAENVLLEQEHARSDLYGRKKVKDVLREHGVTGVIDLAYVTVGAYHHCGDLRGRGLPAPSFCLHSGGRRLVRVADRLEKSMAAIKYNRVLLKISGEGLCRAGGFGIDGQELRRIATEVKSVHDLGAQVAVVVGGGNIVRGTQIAQNSSIEEVTGHYMGMLGTVINALAVQDTLESLGVATRVQSAVAVDRVCEKFIRRRAIRHLEKGRVVIFAGGTGNPFVTTDTGAALRASEIGADALLKATKVEGIFDDDPATNPDARLQAHLSYNTIIDTRLKVMDVSAVDMCQRNRIPIIVFNLKRAGNMRDVVLGKSIGTLVDAHGPAGVVPCDQSTRPAQAAHDG